MKYLEAQALAAVPAVERKNGRGPAENKAAPKAEPVAPVVTEQEAVAPVAPEQEPDVCEDDFTRTEEVGGAEFMAPEAPAAPTKGKKSEKSSK